MQSTLGSEQLSWFLNDLENINRTNTPWVIVAWHAPAVRAPTPALVQPNLHGAHMRAGCLQCMHANMSLVEQVPESHSSSLPHRRVEAMAAAAAACPMC